MIDIVWKIPPPPVSEKLKRIPSIIAHAVRQNEQLSVCKKISGLDKGGPAFDSDKRCLACVSALQEDMLQRLGKKKTPAQTDTEELDEYIREGVIHTKMIKMNHKVKCVWSPWHFIQKGEGAVQITDPEDNTTDYVCLPCWDKERTEIYK